MNNQRRKDIDIAKAIGIIMVVWGHTYAPLSNYFKAFHMPLFFFLAGVIFKYNDNYKEYCFKKVKSLLVPFWTWNLLLIVPCWLLSNWKQWDFIFLTKYIIKIIVTIDELQILTATWFLPALFWTSVIFALFYKIFHKNKFCNLILIAIALIILFQGIVYNFPYTISRTLICSFFFPLGFIYNKYFEPFLEKQFDKLKGILICNATAIICLISFVLLTNINFINLNRNLIKYPILFVLGCILAIYSIIIISKDLSKIDKGAIKHIIYIGQNTMPVIIWHFIFFKIIILIQIIIYKVPLNNISAFPIYNSSNLWWVAYILVGLYGSLLWGIVLNKIFKSRKQKKIQT